MFTRKQTGLLAAALLSTTLFGNAFAAVTLDVSATVAAECTVASTTNLAFGTYSPVNGTAALAIGNIAVACTTGTIAPSIALNDGENPGAGSSGVVPVRRMANGIHRLGYSLYQDVGRTVTWGNGVTSKLVTTPDGSVHDEPVYGRVAAGQNVPIGAYGDTVFVTLQF